MRIKDGSMGERGRDPLERERVRKRERLHLINLVMQSKYTV